MGNCISKHIVEIRFKPNASILDKRGHIAESLLGTRFDSWEIGPNRINLKNKDCKEIAGFFSVKNMGFSSAHPRSLKDFIDEAKDFIKGAWGFRGTSEITRIGVRSRFLTEVSDFKEAFVAYRDCFLKLGGEEIKKFGGELKDVGFPMTFKMGDRSFNITTGAMEKKQALEYYGDEEGVPEASNYVEVDYFKTAFRGEYKQRDALRFIEVGTKKAEEINKLISGWVCKGD